MSEEFNFSILKYSYVFGGWPYVFVSAKLIESVGFRAIWKKYSKGANLRNLIFRNLTVLYRYKQAMYRYILALYRYKSLLYRYILLWNWENWKFNCLVSIQACYVSIHSSFVSIQASFVSIHTVLVREKISENGFGRNFQTVSPF